MRVSRQYASASCLTPLVLSSVNRLAHWSVGSRGDDGALAQPADHVLLRDLQGATSDVMTGFMMWQPSSDELVLTSLALVDRWTS